MNAGMFVMKKSDGWWWEFSPPVIEPCLVI